VRLLDSCETLVRLLSSLGEAGAIGSKRGVVSQLSGNKNNKIPIIIKIHIKL